MERHYADGTEPDVLPHWECHGPCQQGRHLCPTPDACERPGVEARSQRLSTFFVAAACLVAALAMAAVVF